MTGVVESPVRARILLGAAGRERRTLHIFCTRRSASMPLPECRSCERCLSYQAASDRDRATLTCQMGAPAPLPPSGLAVGVDVMCVEPDVLLAEVDARIPRKRTIVPVIGEDGRALGVVDLDRHRRSPVAALHTMRELMIPTPRVVEEATPLDQALRTMAVARARWLAVVTHDQLAAGILWDVEAMHHLFAAPL